MDSSTFIRSKFGNGSTVSIALQCILNEHRDRSWLSYQFGLYLVSGILVRRVALYFTWKTNIFVVISKQAATHFFVASFSGIHCWWHVCREPSSYPHFVRKKSYKETQRTNLPPMSGRIIKTSCWIYLILVLHIWRIYQIVRPNMHSTLLSPSPLIFTVSLH